MNFLMASAVLGPMPPLPIIIFTPVLSMNSGSTLSILMLVVGPAAMTFQLPSGCFTATGPQW
ncbi:MAG: hypothetical protein OSP8Acid_06590 [uncultured Acidilobus sp. OSP8]|nr:MAG: hypothetical protein OSP8Acid_06590 [uncultured Acidilobus sp. OSP8]